MSRARSDGERIRARHMLATLRTILDSASIAIEDTNAPPGADIGQTLTQAAISMAVTLGKLDAYMRASDDLEKIAQTIEANAERFSDGDDALEWGAHIIRTSARGPQ